MMRVRDVTRSQERGGRGGGDCYIVRGEPRPCPISSGSYSSPSEPNQVNSTGSANPDPIGATFLLVTLVKLKSLA